jgi:hypothetical protein
MIANFPLGFGALWMFVIFVSTQVWPDHEQRDFG